MTEDEQRFEEMVAKKKRKKSLGERYGTARRENKGPLHRPTALKSHYAVDVLNTKNDEIIASDIVHQRNAKSVLQADSSEEYLDQQN